MAHFWQLADLRDILNGMKASRNAGTEAEMNGYRFPAYVVRDRDGWAAYCPEFPDCRACGRTYEDALDNLRDIIQVFIEDGLGDDEAPPRRDSPAFRP
jgi:predicted RNase H-like HicB family nuclease